jgi:hypothetical protein
MVVHTLNQRWNNYSKQKFAVLGLLMDFYKLMCLKLGLPSGFETKILNSGATGGLLQPYGYFKDENKKTCNLLKMNQNNPNHF